MINIISKPLEFDYELKKKIEIICDYCNTKPKIINGNIRDIEHSNLFYIEPHRVIIKEITKLNKDKEKDDGLSFDVNPNKLSKYSFNFIVSSI